MVNTHQSCNITFQSKGREICSNAGRSGERSHVDNVFTLELSWLELGTRRRRAPPVNVRSGTDARDPIAVRVYSFKQVLPFCHWSIYPGVASKNRHCNRETLIVVGGCGSLHLYSQVYRQIRGARKFFMADLRTSTMRDGCLSQVTHLRFQTSSVRAS